MPGARKKEQSSQSRQRWFNRALLVSILVVVIVVTAYVFSRSSAVPLPPYLNRCVPSKGPYAYESAPQLVLNISGGFYRIPAGIGIAGSCLRPLSTVDTSGVIHIVTDVNQSYTLGDFFLVWGNTLGPDFATFNQYQIFNYRADGQSHTLSMSVNNSPDYSFQNYVFPRNATFRGNIDVIYIVYT